MVKIDIFSHIQPPKYFGQLQKESRSDINFNREKNNLANIDLDVRFRLMDRYPDVLQVLSISQPPLEAAIESKTTEVELARLANDELAELVVRYPNKFYAAVACLPMKNIELALEEAERAITQLNLRGVQIYSNINGEPLNSPRLKPLFQKMAEFDLPIWIHPYMGLDQGEPIFGWPYETSKAMLQLVTSGVFRDFPNIRILIHHCGAMAPFFEKRIQWSHSEKNDIVDPVGQFKKFYCDTATWGSTAALTCALSFFGPDRILFGTDAPLGPPYGFTQETIHSVEQACISEEDREKIFCQNALKLLRVPL